MTWETDLFDFDNNDRSSKRLKTLPGPELPGPDTIRTIRWVGVVLPGKRKARQLPFFEGEPNIVSNVFEHFKVPMGHHLWLRGQDITLRFFDTPQELGLNDGDILVCTTSGHPSQRQASTSCPVLRQRVTFAPTHVQIQNDHVTKDDKSVYNKPPAVSPKRLRDYKKTFEEGGGVAVVRLRQEVQGRYPKGGASLVVALFSQVGVSNTPCMLEVMVPFYDGKDMANAACADRMRQDALAEAVAQGWVRTTRGCGTMVQLTDETHHMLMFMC